MQGEAKFIKDFSKKNKTNLMNKIGRQSSAISQVKLTKEGLATLPKTKTCVNIMDYSITTQGVEQC